MNYESLDETKGLSPLWKTLSIMPFSYKGKVLRTNKIFFKRSLGRDRCGIGAI